MNTHRDLDSAIDFVAKTLTRVEDDPMFASRIVAALPERATWCGWLATSWAPRLAMLTLAAASSLLLLSREPATLTSAPLPAASTFMVAALPPALEPVSLGTRPLEPVEPLEPLESARADHEFSLPGLEVEALPLMDLPAVAPIEISPLTIVDLPLSSEFPERY